MRLFGICQRNKTIIGIMKKIIVRQKILILFEHYLFQKNYNSKW